MEIIWTEGGQSFLYGDKSVEGLEGKILELSNLENIINISGSSNSQSISLKLDDTDGTLKTIYNTNDIHKRPVKIYQWFEGLPLSEKFLIFEGEISSPIVWDEGDRTISFEVISKLEDNEVGFSVEEGEFTNVPDFLIGTPWPLPFGTCLKVPAIQLDPIPTGIQLHGTGIADPTINNQISKLEVNLSDFQALADEMFKAALNAYDTASRIGEETNPEWTALNKDTWDSSFRNLGDQLTEKGNEYLVQLNQIRTDITNLQQTRSAQQAQEKARLKIHDGNKFPQNTPIQVYLGGAIHSGEMSGNDFVISERVHPTINPQEIDFLDINDPQIQKGTFFWAKGGAGFKIRSALKVRYIVAMIPVDVLNVFARRNFGDVTKTMAIPKNFYSVSTETYGSIVATIITLNKPLSSRNDQWEDDLFVDIESPIGPNTVDILEWLISNYTTLNIDATTFDEVRAILEDYPSNFCLLDRRNILDVLSDIAFQARCAIWLNNGTFYLRFLPFEPTPVDSITLSDISQNSLVIEHTSTEELITKLIARYKTTYDLDEFKYIFRHNIGKYGTQEEDIDWFIYNHPELVALAATYWLIQRANTWKILKFRTPLHKLRLEPFDPVAINLSQVASEEVVGRVLTVSYDSEEFELEFEVWIPVRLGEMTQYNFAYLVDSQTLIFPNVEDDFGSKGPGRNASGDLKPINRAEFQGVRYGNLEDMGSLIRNIDFGYPRPGTPPDVSLQILSVPDDVDDSDSPAFDYQYNNYRPTEFTGDGTITPRTVPGKIKSGDGPKYVVDVYEKGIAGSPTVMRDVTDVNFKTKTKANTWVMVSINVFKEGDNFKIEKNFASIPGASGCVPGKILSGSGDTYQMEIYREGLSATPVVKSVKQLKIDPASSFQPDMWSLVSIVEKEGGTEEFTMQLPVFDKE